MNKWLPLIFVDYVATRMDTERNNSQKMGNGDTTTSIFFKIMLLGMNIHIVTTNYLDYDSYGMHYLPIVYAYTHTDGFHITLLPQHF